MKQVSQQEFEGYVRKLIDGKTTKTAIAKKLETGIKKVNYMIDELATTNPTLYMELLKKNPYVPRNTEVDPSALAIEVIKYGRKDVAQDVGISIRTITRTVNKLKEINPTLYELYRRRRKKMSQAERKAFMRAVDRETEKLGYHTNLTRKSVKDRLEEVKRILSKFEALVDSGMTYRDASKELGYSSNATIWMMYQDKKKMELEIAMQQKQSEEEKDAAKAYREKMRVDYKRSKTTTTNEESKTGEVIQSGKKKNETSIKVGKGRDD